MLREFIDFVDSVLPSVSPDFRDGAKNAVSQFEKDGQQINYLTATLLPELFHKCHLHILKRMVDK